MCTQQSRAVAPSSLVQPGKQAVRWAWSYEQAALGVLSSLGWQAADLTSRADEATGLLAPKPGPLPSAAVCPADTCPPCAHLAH